jgi:imidazolonepropionase-like amidohydrolase
MSDMKFAKLCLVAASFIASSTWLAQAEVPPVLAIKDARVVTVSGPILDKGTVVIRRGLIEAVGANVSIPPDAWVIEGAGLTVYPGLIDGLSTWGITDETALMPRPGATPGGSGAPRPAAPVPPSRGPEDRPSTATWLKAQDLVRPNDRRLEQARNAGFTSAVSFPNRGIFAGQGALINLAGANGGAMVIAPSVGQYVAFVNSLSGGYPGSLMGSIAYVRQVYLDAEYYKSAKARYAAKADIERPAYDRALEGLAESNRVLLPATRTTDVDRMIAFANELKLTPILYGLHRGYARAPQIAKSGVPVLVSLRWPERGRDVNPDSIDSLRTLHLREEAPSTPKALADAKAKFAFYSDGIERPADAIRNVKKALDAGLSHADAVRAMTLSVAEIYGVANRLGSIEKGKIANLTVTKGDLFREGTKVEFVLIDGVKYEPTPELPTPGGAGANATPTEEEDTKQVEEHEEPHQ